ncbi:hypothetical protein CF394_01080 [Tetzosporium hominis]|uniref:DUF3267 domain-containing protein n=1 Tax=Tetzosporium hominis TaxID=2020506 RepID=A0A264W626_9BACL|nr:DUF3267 domain-containing protein [Tetzosporium hominis]OZS79044.1 hypothetical protein CF394_01080 [Tetzosporium hominis]
MQCWKSINIKRQYGYDRLFLISSFIVFMVFSFTYIGLSFFSESGRSSDYFIGFVLSFLAVYPIHKLLHYLPLSTLKGRVRLKRYMHFRIIPMFMIRICEPIGKGRFILALLMPFIVLSTVFIGGVYIFPVFAHYFIILFAYHCGMCVIDLIYVKELLHSPKKAWIEEIEDGYEILVAPRA